jgi:hypothetical protein
MTQIEDEPHCAESDAAEIIPPSEVTIISESRLGLAKRGFLPTHASFKDRGAEIISEYESAISASNEPK